MKKLMLMVGVIVLVSVGCTTDFHKNLEALANDPADINISLSGGRHIFRRSMPTNWQHTIYVTNTVTVPVSLQSIKQ